MPVIAKDFSIFYKKKFVSTDQLKADSNYDVFISAYNDSKRVREVFNEINASNKHWILFPEYKYKKSEEPTLNTTSEKIFTFDDTLTEGGIIRKYINDSEINLLNGDKICVDITGFIRPHLVFLIRLFSSMGAANIDFIYTDPIKYEKGAQTDFSSDYTLVRQIDGCQGSHNPETTNDFLIIGAGYDHLRIMDVSKNKDNTKKVQLFGFPSLQPDMYQENILKAYKAAEETVSKGEEIFVDDDNTIFAPANDPFVTANILRDFIKKQQIKKTITNLYFCPLSTKAQTLGIALYYISECIDTPTSIIFPICSRYSRETTEGISKIWRYTVEFHNLK
ncbi:MAG: hypothetical protein JWR09_1845 [Mucilaginibacter sp.]|nr:hypothetical protein [Mucilaginibacter sp.]